MNADDAPLVAVGKALPTMSLMRAVVPATSLANKRYENLIAEIWRNPD